MLLSHPVPGVQVACRLPPVGQQGQDDQPDQHQQPDLFFRHVLDHQRERRQRNGQEDAGHGPVELMTLPVRRVEVLVVGGQKLQGGLIVLTGDVDLKIIGKVVGLVRRYG